MPLPAVEGGGVAGRTTGLLGAPSSAAHTRRRMGSTCSVRSRNSAACTYMGVRSAPSLAISCGARG